VTSTPGPHSLSHYGEFSQMEGVMIGNRSDFPQDSYPISREYLDTNPVYLAY